VYVYPISGSTEPRTFGRLGFGRRADEAFAVGRAARIAHDLTRDSALGVGGT
jgi:hypothetical protein